VTGVAPIEAGSAATFALSVDGRAAVLKVDVAGDGLPVEPAVCRLVARETSIPVPTGSVRAASTGDRSATRTS